MQSLLLYPFRSPLRLSLFALAAAALAFTVLRPDRPQPLRVGVVHALSGAMADSEYVLVDALRLAAEEINTAGGVLGRPVELIVADSRSDWEHAAAEADRLITRERVSALFGCWTSACRKALLPVVERHRHLLFYPLQFEGMEQSQHIVYLGAAPNQQIIPGARWAIQRHGPRIFLLGSDYVFPRMANRLIRDLTTTTGSSVVGEAYLPAGADDAAFALVTEELRRNAPDVVLNTLYGDANRRFFAALAEAGLGEQPVVSFSMGEPELATFGLPRAHPAHHAVWGYFQSLEDPANQRFVERFQARYGQHRVLSDPMVTSYNALRLWAATAEKVGTDEPQQVDLAIPRMSIDGPTGIVALDSTTRHAWRRVFIGRARADGQFDVVELSEAPVRPTPFPAYRGRRGLLRAAQDPNAPAAVR
ncbi:ABC transporter substrate-binding protein [Pseudothauera nasutitermitis]|uniref:ABC transporter substrate-binding protein n=1 Tax=Pseudothauera nasutitermitis TaxID=2565930 RepID=A0A4V3WC37_9RHOO|nr:urea ABC transporter substrate-binding protein [Pseudothauera nasutitermitis]THF65665.1 ABC transporter substrate-binding protein [Pseudothauera nasutitermitis]